jgi:hypothetical protein
VSAVWYFKEKQHDLSSKLIYRSIINNIDTAVLILEKKMTTGPFSWWTIVFQLFSASQWLIGLSQNYLPSLCQEIENTGFNELKTSINIKIEQQEAQTFMLQTSLTKSFNKDYFIILLDSIQRVEKKKRSLDLMKIISRINEFHLFDRFRKIYCKS